MTDSAPIQTALLILFLVGLFAGLYGLVKYNHDQKNRRN